MIVELHSHEPRVVQYFVNEDSKTTFFCHSNFNCFLYFSHKLTFTFEGALGVVD